MFNETKQPNNSSVFNKGGHKALSVRFWWIGLMVAVVIVSVIFLLHKKNDKQDNVKNSSSDEITDENQKYSQTKDDAKQISNGKCKGEEKRKLGTLPMKNEDFSMILPYGLTIGGHVTPIDHQYFSPEEYNSPRDKYPVYAMADANIVDISERTNEKGTEYRFVFSISCKLFYYYDLVTSLAPDIKTQYENKQRNLDVSVKEGQLVGYIGGQTLDFAVWDMDVSLSGFAVPEHYEGEAWKIHTADPLNYYTDELKAKALAKYIREQEPRSGKIDYDIDGKLIGNWFKEGTDGYVQEGKWQDYWKGHLSIAPDAYDPTSIVVSMGDYDGKEMQFGIKGNAPDPAITDSGNGMIKYELIQKDWIDATGKHWDRMSVVKGIKAKNHDERVEGVVLIQMTENRKLRFEAFPNKTANQVSEFTSNAVNFER